MVISGTTKIIFMVGYPIGQAQSPAIMNARFERMGADVAVVPVAIQPEGIDDFLRSLRRMDNVLGAIFTMPFKQAAFAGCDRVSPRARLLGACNVARRETDASISGDMTDGLGYLSALASHKIDPAGKTAIVIGAGGVGSAIAGALAEAKADKILLLDIDHERQQNLSLRLAEAFPHTLFLQEADDGFMPDIIANATPLGMRPGDPLPYPPDRLPPTAFVSDVVTSPEITPFLKAAKQRGCRIQTGIEMVAPQASLFADFVGAPFQTN